MNAPMPKVAHIATIDLSLRYLLLGQMLYLRRAGYDVVGISASGPNVPVIEAAGIRHIPVAMTRRMTPLADMRALLQLVRIMRKERFSIVHTHTPKPGLIGQLAARITRTPIVVNTLHGFYFHEHMRPAAKQFYVSVERIAARCSDAILSQNKEDMVTALELGICRSDQIHWLGNGIDIERFDRRKVDAEQVRHKRNELGIPPDKRVIGFVGRLVEEKGVLELFASLARICDEFPDVVLLLVGPLDAEKKDVLSSRAASKYGIADRCYFAGFRNDMPYMYAMMDVLVLPSHREGFPRAPMEASAMGVPCIVTNIRGCREAVLDGQNGMLVPLRNVEALSRSLSTLLVDRKMTARFGANGRTLAVEQFDERLIFARVNRHYARLMHAKDLASACAQQPGRYV